MTAGERVLRLLRRFEELLRYYGVGLVNTAFGYGCFLLLTTLGLNIFAAQLIAHLIGMAFNYSMFRRHVFRASRPAIGSYLAAYGVNYLLSLGLLAIFVQLVRSPALAGLLTLMTASAVNYFVLKFLVFRRAAA